MEKAETQAVEPRIRAGKPEALAVEHWPWMVRPWIRAVQPGFWTGSPELGRMQWRSERNDGEAGGGTESSVVEPGA